MGGTNKADILADCTGEVRATLIITPGPVSANMLTESTELNTLLELDTWRAENPQAGALQTSLHAEPDPHRATAKAAVANYESSVVTGAVGNYASLVPAA